MIVFTIGVSDKTAQQFFTLINKPALARVIDIRPENTVNLGGFSKKNNLPFLLQEMGQREYVRNLELVPDRNMLDDAKLTPASFHQYKQQVQTLLSSRKIETTIPRELIDGACLMCNEPRANHCYRKVLAEYLKDKWGDMIIMHL